jgi:hypothetical protein
MENGMFKFVGGVVVYGFALYGFGKYLHRTTHSLPQSDAADGSSG